MDVRVATVIPCYNEATRLPAEDFLRFQRATPNVDFVFVNDGSTDGTLAVLDRMVACAPTRFAVVNLKTNQGKSEAVRTGIQVGLKRGCSFIGYWDADLATPLEEICRFATILEARPECDIVFGARVQLLGLSIDRSPLRHYVGRIFATMTSVTLGLPVYDTQCGAKLFRVAAYTSTLFEAPFCTRWLLDVEIIARLIQMHRRGGRSPEDLILEIPIGAWRDIAGSKVGPGDFVKGLWDLRRIYKRYLKVRS
jgi:dolichyl-phosphate beta-glucosyltransferase